MNNKIGIAVILPVFLLLASSSLGTKVENTRYLSELLGGNVRGLPPPPGYTATDARSFKSDIIVPKNYRTTQYQVLTGQSGPSPSQTAMFMIGKISVSMVFLESNGAIDASTEDWTSSRITDYTNRIKSGLNWLKSQQPNARISYVYHVQTIQTSYEPIARPQTDEGLWVTEAMNSLGYTTGDYHDRVTRYNNDLRAADKTHWAYTIFIVDSLIDADGMFADKVPDYMAGPFIVMTYDNDGWGVGGTDKSVAHETGHEFGAEDEYHIYGTNYCFCLGPNGEKSGFLQVPNSNCISGCYGTGCGNCAACYTSNCLMENLNFCLTSSTNYELGWRDLNGNGILDAIDTTYNSWTDSDRDGVVDYLDNCPNTPNPDQKDSDNDWIGDVCLIHDITILSPSSQTTYTVFKSYYFGVDKIPLNFTLNGPKTWIGYSLDGGPTVTISGNTTLIVATSGTHNVIVYAKDSAGNGSISEKIFFNVIVKSTCYNRGLCAV
jgi:hypothetical protein